MPTFILTLQENIFDVHHLVDFPMTVDNMTVANVSHRASMTHSSLSYTCTHSVQSNPPPHLHGLLQVLGGCTEAVDPEGEVLHNRVDPLTSSGHAPHKVTTTALDRCECIYNTSRRHHTKSPPVHLTDVYTCEHIQCKQSERYNGGYN